MFQREVADRLSAKPGTKSLRQAVGDRPVAGGGASAVQPARPRLHATAEIESTVVQFIPRRPTPEPAEFSAMEAVTAAAFGQRRKMLRASLKSLGNAEALIDEAAAFPTQRAEEVPVAGFAALARAWRASGVRRRFAVVGRWPTTPTLQSLLSSGAFLKLPNEVRQADLAAAFQALGFQDRLDLMDAVFDIVIDDHVFVSR